MSSTRSRRTNKRKSYIEKNDSDFEDIQSSGSDFEDEIQKQNGMKKFSKSQADSTSSSEDEELMEEEEEWIEENCPKKKSLSKNLSKSAAIKKNGSSIVKKTGIASTINLIKTKPAENVNVVGGSSLNLSESSSDEDETKPTTSKYFKSSPIKKSYSTSFQEVQSTSKEKSEKTNKNGNNDDFISSQFQSLLSTQASVDDIWMKKEAVPSPKKSTKSQDDVKFDDDVAKILAQGEQKELSLSDDDEESEEMTQVEEIKQELPSTGDIEITIDMPDNKRKRKKGFDINDHIRKLINRTKRETQLNMHKTHIVCLVAHLQFLHKILSSETLMGCALSIIPPAQFTTQREMTIPKISLMVRWFKSAFKEDPLASFELFPYPLEKHYQKVIAKKSCKSYVDEVVIFFLLMKSMGLNVRLVMNFNNLVSMKLTKNEIEGKVEIVVKDENEASTSKYFKNKPSTSKNIKKETESESESPSKKRKLESPSKKLSHLCKNDIKSNSKKRKSVSDSPEESKKSKTSSKKPSKSNYAEDSTKLSKRTSKQSSKTDIEESKKNSNKRSSSRQPTKTDSAESSNKSSKRSTRSSRHLETKNVSPRKTRSKASKKDSDEKQIASNECRRGRKSPRLVEKISSKSKKKESRESSQDSSKSSTKEKSLSKSALKEAKSRSSKSSKKRVSHYEYDSETESENEFEYKPKPRKSSTSVAKTSSSSKVTKDNPIKINKGSSGLLLPYDYWIELQVKSKWISVDVFHGKVDCVEDLQKNATQPVLYIVALNTDGSLKDVTKRYAKDYMTDTRKKRVDEDWFQSTLEPFASRDSAMDKKEETELNSLMEKAPMPTTIGAFKNHPLYILPRHLLKFEAIYPPDAVPLGYIRSEPIYARECLHNLHCRTTWLKEGRTVKLHEEPYKIVKARPKFDRMTGSVVKDQPLEIFGEWQTEIYVPPPAKDGKIPRNEYGNVELFKPWMLPKGTVHIPIAGLSRVAKKLKIDCAQAMMGWDFHEGRVHPVFEGYVVCEEFKDILLDAWNADVEERARREEEKREKRIYDNWKKLIKGLLIAQKIKNKYGQ